MFGGAAKKSAKASFAGKMAPFIGEIVDFTGWTVYWQAMLWVNVFVANAVEYAFVSEGVGFRQLVLGEKLAGMQPPEISLRGMMGLPDRLATNPDCLWSDESKVMGFYLVVAWMKLLCMLTSMSISLVYTRLVLFEKIYASYPYITERPKGTRISSEYPAWDHAFFWVTVGHTMIYSLRSLDYELITMTDIYQTVILYIATDLCFWVSHGIMHTRSFMYPNFHKMHHSVHKPTSYEHCEKFTYIDGISHMVCFWTAYRMLFLLAPYNPLFLANGTGMISDKIWVLACIQWYQVGQWQHGGKNIPSNQVPGLKFAMKMCGVKEGMCLLHDLHHTKFHYNFGMTGIWDKLFGTNYKTELENIKQKGYQD